MKLYLKDIQNLNINKIKQYKKSSSKIEKIFSNEGIFIVENNKYKKELNKTGEIKLINYDNVELYTDTTNVYYENEFRIPFDHFYTQYTKDTFSLRNKAIVDLHIFYLNKSIVDVYFETDYHFDDFALKEDILSFIKLLN